ncbi:hypothetical protein BH11PSE3_BH11PSE3_02380 [soil metagenome]
MKLSRRKFCAFSMGCPVAIAADDAIAQAQPTVWYAVRGVDNSFYVDMPGEPVYKVIDTRSPDGAAFAYHSYSLEVRGLSFVTQTALYPADVDVRQPRLNLQSVLDDRAQRLAGGKWTSIEWRDLQGTPAVESVGAIAGGKLLRQLVLLKGRRFVSLAYLAPANALRTPEAERFFKSLRMGA